jgi:hypothetical protein
MNTPPYVSFNRSVKHGVCEEEKKDIPTNFRDFKIREAEVKAEDLKETIETTKWQYKVAIRNKIRNEQMPEFKFRSWEMNQAVYKIEKTLLSLGLTSDEIQTLHDNYTTDAHSILDISEKLENTPDPLDALCYRYQPEPRVYHEYFTKKKSWFKKLIGKA